MRSVNRAAVLVLAVAAGAIVRAQAPASATTRLQAQTQPAAPLFPGTAPLPAPAPPPPAIDPAAMPIEQEPRHHLVFSNEFVRIIDAQFPPLYVSMKHTHLLDNVAITIVPGIEGPRGQARVGFAAYSPGGYSHVLTNPNDGFMRIIAVELRAPDRGFGDETPQPGHTTVLSNGRVHVTRVRLAAGETIPEHHHPNGYVSVVVRGSDAGVWRWHRAGESAPLAADRSALELIEVEPR